MAIRQKLTPDAFITAPRRGDAVPSPSGRVAFVTVTTHTLGEGKKKEVLLLDIGTGKEWQVLEDEKVDDVNWIPGSDNDTLIWLRTNDDGSTEVTVLPAPQPDQTSEPYVAGILPAPVEGLKLRQLADGSVALGLIGLVGDDGELFNDKAKEKEEKGESNDGDKGTTAEDGKAKPKPKKVTTARIYDQIRVREWDTYLKPQMHTLWYTTLAQKDGKWALNTALHNALKGTNLHTPADAYNPGDFTDAFDLAEKAIVFVAQDPTPKRQEIRSFNVHLVTLESYSAAVAKPHTRVVPQGEKGPITGRCFNPRFSPDGSMVTFIREPFECPADARLYMGHIGSGSAFDVFNLTIGEKWSMVPSSFEYAPLGESLFVKVEECGRNSLFEVDLRHGAKPRKLSSRGSVSSFFAVRTPDSKEHSVLISGSSFVESKYVQVVDRSGAFEPRMVAEATKDGARFGLSTSQVSEIYYEGAGDYCVQAWVLRPSDFDEKKKYPVALLIHGGPAGSYKDEWHMRWNGILWAEQGWVVVMPNFSGSTGFGIEHATRIYGQWGGYPYEDLVNCMKYLENIPYIDLDRAIAAGGSYGGYMVNWINGNPLGRKFKAIVCHDCVFSTLSMTLMSDEPDGIGEWKGTAFVWDNYETLNKWNPSRPDLLKNWKHAAPTLVIHSDNDYRCPVTEGLATFKTLQYMGVKSRYLNFPDENHFVQGPENSLVWHNTVFDWINEHTGTKKVGEAAKEEQPLALL